MPTAPETVLPSSGAASSPDAPSVILATASGGSAPTAPATVLGSAAGGSAPASPATVLAVNGAGSAPTSPATVLGSAAGGSAPASPATVLAVAGGGSAPSAPEGVLGAAGGNAPQRMWINGAISPDATGELLPVASPISSAYASGPQWSTNGNSTHPTTGAWVTVYTGFLLTPAAATLNEIAPPANYLATGSQSTASQIITIAGTITGGYTIYWLYDNNDGNPATSKWVDAADAGMVDRGSTVIAAGWALNPNPRMTDKTFIGGLGHTWEISPSTNFKHFLLRRFNNASAGVWYGEGNTPMSATWTGIAGGASGAPMVSLGTVPPPLPVLP